MQFGWDPNKNKVLTKNKRPSFEEVIQAMRGGFLIEDVINPSSRYPNQFAFVVKINNYLHLVPYEIRGDIYWLITVIPCRKLKKKYRDQL